MSTKLPKKKSYNPSDFNRYGKEWASRDPRRSIANVKFSGATLIIEPVHKFYGCTFNNCVIVLKSYGRESSHHLKINKFNNCVIRDKRGDNSDVTFGSCTLKSTVVKSPIGLGEPTEKTHFINCEIKKGYGNVDFKGVNLDGTKGFKYADTSIVEHKGVTAEEKVVMGRNVQKLARALNKVKNFKTLLKKVIALEEQYVYKKHFGSELRTLRVEIRKRIKEKLRKNQEEARLRQQIQQEVQLLNLDLARAQGDDELVPIMMRADSLLEDPLAEEFKADLGFIQETAKSKLSLWERMLKNKRKLFNEGRRASQIRTASQMLNHLNKEAGVFDSFSEGVLKSILEKVLKMMVEENLISEHFSYSPSIKFIKRGGLESAFVKGNNDLGDFSIRVNKKGENVVVFLRPSEGGRVLLGKDVRFSLIDPKASERKILQEVGGSLKSKGKVGLLHELLTGYNPHL
jgi:hypothetical protein